MAAFASFAAAEARAYALVLNHTWNNAHAERMQNGTIAVRVQRLMKPTNASTRQDGDWEELTDDTQV